MAKPAAGHSTNLDRDKLDFACKLIGTAYDKRSGPFDFLNSALTIMQFGGVSVQDMLDWIEATGGNPD